MDSESADIMRYYGYTDVVSPQDLRDGLSEADGGDVTIFINSGGGSLIAGHEIYCDLKSYAGSTTAHVQSLSASAATIVMMACKKRVAEAVSILCVHNPSTWVYGDHNEISKTVKDLETLKNSILNAYEKVLKLSRAEISDLMDEDKLLDVNQALEIGLVDEIIGEVAEPVAARYVASSVPYIFPTPEMRKQYAQNQQTKQKALLAQALRLKILSK